MFKSAEDLFRETEKLIITLREGGQVQEADTLKEGMRCLNGLTDGWAGFLDSIKCVHKSSLKALGEKDQEVLTQIYDAAYFAVYRRRRNAWWRFWSFWAD
jgi:hypothetical protein